MENAKNVDLELCVLLHAWDIFCIINAIIRQ